jgi:hypothetical protein
MPQNAQTAAYLLFSFMGTSSSFLAFAILAEKHDLPIDQKSDKKTIYYLGGLTEGFETILAFVLICLFPDYFNAIALIFGTACWITTSTRIYTAYQTFKDI